MVEIVKEEILKNDQSINHDKIDVCKLNASNDVVK